MIYYVLKKKDFQIKKYFSFRFFPQAKSESGISEQKNPFIPILIPGSLLLNAPADLPGCSPCTGSIPRIFNKGSGHKGVARLRTCKIIYVSCIRPGNGEFD
jgi:hypothetical protein